MADPDLLFSNHEAGAVPAYTIPLSDAELADLGRLTAIWAQIDTFLDNLIEKAFDLDPPKRRALLGMMMAGPKIKLLLKWVESQPPSTTNSAIIDFAKKANAIKAKRNHSAHGAWCWRRDDKRKTFRVEARSGTNTETPLRATELKQIVEKAAVCSVAGLRATELAIGARHSPPPVIMTASKNEDHRPAWVLELYDRLAKRA